MLLGQNATTRRKIFAEHESDSSSVVPFPQLRCNRSLPLQRLEYDKYVDLDATGDPHETSPLPSHAEVDLYLNRARIPEKWCFSVSCAQFLIPGVQVSDIP